MHSQKSKPRENIVEEAERRGLRCGGLPTARSLVHTISS